MQQIYDSLHALLDLACVHCASLTLPCCSHFVPGLRLQTLYFSCGETVLRLTASGVMWHMQALMLPEAVRLLHLLVTNGKRVYVHCTAGINRATLTTVGYLTFVKVCCCVPQLGALLASPSY